MNFSSIQNYLFGYVRVKVKGVRPERLVNLMLSSDFRVWDIRTVDDGLLFSTPLAKYKNIRALAKKAHCTPRIVARKGLPFTLGKIKRRPMFLLVGLVIFLIYAYLSGGVWMIRVKGQKTVSEKTITDAAKSAGLSIGARKSLISPDNVERSLCIQIPELSWAYVHFQGTMAVIEVVEKVRPEVPPPGDVVSRKEGLIQSILVLSGVPVVSPGQTVKKGEILIAGNPGDQNGAKGEVMARTWYQVYTEIPLFEKKSYRTGRKIEMYVLKINGNELGLRGTRNLFDWYEIEEYPTGISFAGIGKDRLELIKRVLFEVKWEESTLSVEEAKALGEKRGKAAISRQLPPLVKVLEITSQSEVLGGEIVGVLVTFSCLEEIGETRPWPGVSPQNGGR